uniref:Uncharacterized protein n=1 Tax=Caloglossa beccarii TaxID=131038 RepID=A0A1Z1M9D8_9FLOR|nr:hypothetical protein [Caloglossa beccarii]ARW62385.1 hypothetical protein [Caloglossa beccarii]
MFIRLLNVFIFSLIIMNLLIFTFTIYYKCNSAQLYTIYLNY